MASRTSNRPSASYNPNQCTRGAYVSTACPPPRLLVRFETRVWKWRQRGAWRDRISGPNINSNREWIAAQGGWSSLCREASLDPSSLTATRHFVAIILLIANQMDLFRRGGLTRRLLFKGIASLILNRGYRSTEVYWDELNLWIFFLIMLFFVSRK